ncbi:MULTISPECIES: MaoC family dehydratase [Metallosphaera]|uniref:MaoC family dehydratase n=1 Tax=Metallosphaera TaxID=41980 RepID=UPI001F05B4C2|nr:MaoC family dehydratase [Metallosphaera sedula]MCH1770414.1 MaoC family dehydratase [Metallosphaera sedula]MCP6727752.1 MaoC family dehydratase [Metallosphaera sedula]
MFGGFGPFFEDFEIGQVIRHRPCRTLEQSDNVLWSTLTLDYTPLYLDSVYASYTEYGKVIMNPRLVHSTVIGLSTRDTSINTLAFLGIDYEEMRRPIYPGDTLCVETEVVGKRESKRPNVGVVSWVHRVFNQRGEPVYEIRRNNLVYKRSYSPWLKFLEGGEAKPEVNVQKGERIGLNTEERGLSHPGWEGRYLEDFTPGETVIHRLGRTVSQYDNLLTTVLSMNTATLHLDDEYMKYHEYGKSVVQGPFVVGVGTGISSFELGGNISADRGIRELKLRAPVFDGDTLHAVSEVVEVQPGKESGRVTLRTRIYKNNFSVEVATFIREIEVFRRESSPWVKIWKG